MNDKFGKRKVLEPQPRNDAVGFGFIFLVLALAAALGTVVFFFASGAKFENVKRAFSDLLAATPNHYHSVAAECEKDWVPRAQNDPQLMCLLTTKLQRLCNSDERAHLAYFYNKYAADRAKYVAEVADRNVRIAANLQGLQNELKAAMQENFKNIQANIEGHPTRVNDDKMAAVIKKMKDAALGGPDGERAENVKRVSDVEITQAIKNLAERGYMTKWDFAWWPDQLVAAGFSGVGTVQEQCKK
jgi:hypothetical protein